ncbi:Haloacid dehalogenase-like hydrolase domain-containing protein, partial [Cucurbita argyrosperma subsp. argyrosperma]
MTLKPSSFDTQRACIVILTVTYALQKLGVVERDCLVVEDSVIGLQAATKAGMQCVVTYTTSTANQDFKKAIATYPDLSDIRWRTGDEDCLAVESVVNQERKAVQLNQQRMKLHICSAPDSMRY